MDKEQQIEEDKALHYLKQRIMSMLSDYNSRARKLESSRKSKQGNLCDSDKIPTYDLLTQSQ